MIERRQSWARLDSFLESANSILESGFCDFLSKIIRIVGITDFKGLWSYRILSSILVSSFFNIARLPHQYLFYFSLQLATPVCNNWNRKRNTIPTNWNWKQLIKLILEYRTQNRAFYLRLKVEPNFSFLYFFVCIVSVSGNKEPHPAATTLISYNDYSKLKHDRPILKE